MLSRKYSITKKEFSIIFKKGKNINSTNLYIKFFPNHKDHSQFSVVISKKVEKIAVKRNRLRRIARSEIYSKLQDISKGYYFIVYIKNIISEKEFKKELINTIKRIK